MSGLVNVNFLITQEKSLHPVVLLICVTMVTNLPCMNVGYTCRGIMFLRLFDQKMDLIVVLLWNLCYNNTANLTWTYGWSGLFSERKQTAPKSG